MNFRRSIRELKKNRYDDLRARNPHVFEWKWYSYRKLKLKLYVETSSVLAYFFIRWKVKPNYITASYALLGILGGILLAVPLRFCIVMAIFFYYFRGILDWADGLVARANNCASISGLILDSYGAHVGWVALWTSLGVYLGNYTNTAFYYLSPGIPALFAADLYSNARDTLIYHGVLKRVGKEAAKNQAGSSEVKSNTRLRKIKTFIDKIFEHNARTVDIILLMIVLELITPYRILWIFYSLFLIWQVTIFVIRFFIVTRGGWAENELSKLRKILYD